MRLKPLGDDTVKQQIIKWLRTIFVIGALVSFAFNGYHAYESRLGLVHMDLVGGAEVKLGNELVFANVLKLRDQNVFGTLRQDGDRIHYACTQIVQGWDGLNVDGHIGSETNQVTITPFDLASLR